MAEKPKNPTPEDIQGWKEKYNGVYVVTLDDAKCYIRKPSRKDIAYASKIQDHIKRQEVLADACFLGGDDEFLTDDDMFFSLSNTIDELIQIKKAEIEKL